MTIRGFVQGVELGARVYLYHVDLSGFGEEDLFLTGGPDGGSQASFGGQLYSPWPIMASGFEMTSGKLPSPTFAIANIEGMLNPLVENNDDLIGASVTRIRTYDRYLDSGVEPNGDAHQPLDIYQLARKERHDDAVIQWKCSALIDQEGVMLPARQAVRDYCNHTTRVWNPLTSTFDYTLATCPYTADDGPPRDVNGLECDEADEVFSKRLSTCCQARFGETAVLPTRAFPGMARVRSSR